MPINRFQPDPQVRRALRALGDRHPNIIALYRFGSSVTGTAGPLSDLDIAVLIKPSTARDRRSLDRRLALVAEIGEACRRSDVDVVLLDDAPPHLAYEIVTGGVLLYERDHHARVAFEARALQHYLDLRPFLATTHAYLKRDLLDGDF